MSSKLRVLPSIYIGILNTIGKVTSRVAKVLCFTIKMTGRRRRGGRRQATGARTGARHLRNRHLSMVLEVKVSAGARGRRRQATGARTGARHLRNRHLSMVLEVKV